MKIGYPCINTSIGCTANTTFRLANYSRERLYKAVSDNLNCLSQILQWNWEHKIKFFRIGSQLVPFASHPVCQEDWIEEFSKEFAQMGQLIKKYGMRVSMHPDQFVLINSPKEEIFRSSVAELVYHCRALDLMELPSSAKVQIHVGGVYGDKETAIERFVKNYEKLPHTVKKRLAIENDHRLYSLADCLKIHQKTGIPVIFDAFHHECLNHGEKMPAALRSASKTWGEKDGLMIVDYSNQAPGGLKGSHSLHLDEKEFRKFLSQAQGIDFDLMLEIKDKEKSALLVKEITDIFKTRNK